MNPAEQIQALVRQVFELERRLKLAESQLAALKHITVRTRDGEGFGEYAQDSIAIRIV